ncbi:MAG: SDR family NAD(P)-dependent oxidoreductase [Butyrivibrio sp.]|jgi:3-oxoacyl-[acyl-carrier protein] reductase|nr:SDR family NAD(P)-dependent oxidoreductase [Butyrivibrio sp.]
MNQHVLITGASRGIGKAIATAFAEAGYHLYLTCRAHGEELQTLAAELEARFQISCHSFVCDMGDEAAVSDLFLHIPSVDIVINNAGIAWIGLLTDMKPEEWHRLMQTNLDSLFYTSSKAVPLMLQQHSGRIINISSVWGNIGASCEVAYSASKGGVNAFTKALAKELAPSEISVNAVACGVIDTEMNRSHLTAEDMEVLKNEIPADRIGTPQEVAQLVLLLAKAPVYMTGQIITIDGGWQ